MPLMTVFVYPFQSGKNPDVPSRVTNQTYLVEQNIFMLQKLSIFIHIFNYMNYIHIIFFVCFLLLHCNLEIISAWSQNIH